MSRPRVVVYVDDDTLRLDLDSIRVEGGAVLEVRRSVKEGTRHFIDPVVYEVTSAGLTTVDTAVEA